MDTMFDTLLQLPLFQGLAQEDFTNILEKVKLHFIRHKAGDVIVHAGEPCDRLVFILRGKVSAVTVSADEIYSFAEHVEAPCVLEPYSLFGMHTVYVSTCTALTECSTVSVSKQFVLTELFRYDIFWINYMNMVSNRAQILRSKLWTLPVGTVEYRIRNFIMAHVEKPSGTKVLKIKMEALAQIVNDTRLNVSRALNSMQERGLVELRRGEVLVPDAAYLFPGAQ